MFFDRNEIHIQKAFGEIPPAKLMSGDSRSSTFHDFQECIISNDQKPRNSESQKFKHGQLRLPIYQKLSNLEINTLELLLIVFSIHSYSFRLKHGLIASFLAFCSAHGSWPMGAGQNTKNER